MVGHGDGAVFALDFFAAAAADDGEGVAAAVEQEQDLLVAGEGGVGFVDEAAGEDLFLADGPELGAHVDEFDGGEGSVHDALAHFDEGVAAALGVGPAFEGGGGGAEDDGGGLEFGAHDGDVAGVVAGVFFLLVAAVVLFVDDEEAEVGERREDGGAGADDDAGVAGADAVPLLGALVGGEGGVEEGDFVAEGGVHLAGHGGGEADLGDEQEGGFAGGEGALHAGDVDGGFAGAGDAVEEVRAEAALGHGGGDGADGFELLFVEGVLVRVLFAGSVDGPEGEGFGFFDEGDEVALDEGEDGGLGDVAAAEAVFEVDEGEPAWVSPETEASSARTASWFSLRRGRASSRVLRTAMRMVRAASRSWASASRRSHFLRTMASSRERLAPVAERRAPALAGSPDSR